MNLYQEFACDQEGFNLFIRSLILGDTVMRKCLECAGTGFVYYNSDTGEPVDRAFGAANYREWDSEQCTDTDQCEVCNGLGYSIAILGANKIKGKR